MRLLSPGFVDKWEGRILNIHPSLLPLHKGLDTHRRALLAGDEFAGCSVHVVTPDLDSGPVVAQAKVRILPRDDAESLAERVLAEEHRLYPLALEEYCRAVRELEGKDRS
jgi:folate-dependent phosphoribosylglycinamide formyltransferase PurN